MGVGKKGVGKTPEWGGENPENFWGGENSNILPVLDTCACMLTR